MDFWKGDLKTLTSFFVVKVVQQMARWYDHKMQKEWKQTNKKHSNAYLRIIRSYFFLADSLCLIFFGLFSRRHYVVQLTFVPFILNSYLKITQPWKSKVLVSNSWHGPMTKDISNFTGMHVFQFNLSLKWETTLNLSWSIKFTSTIISILSATVHV